MSHLVVLSDEDDDAPTPGLPPAARGARDAARRGAVLSERNL